MNINLQQKANMVMTDIYSYTIYLPLSTLRRSNSLREKHNVVDTK
jgi:hypothetical protein